MRWSGGGGTWCTPVGADILSTGLVGESATAEASGGAGMEDFLCLDLGEGWGEGPGEGCMSDWKAPAARGCLERRGEGRGAIGRGGREWTAEVEKPSQHPQVENEKTEEKGSWRRTDKENKKTERVMEIMETNLVLWPARTKVKTTSFLRIKKACEQCWTYIF